MSGLQWFLMMCLSTNKTYLHESDLNNFTFLAYERTITNKMISCFGFLNCNTSLTLTPCFVSEIEEEKEVTRGRVVKHVAKSCMLSLNYVLNIVQFILSWRVIPTGLLLSLTEFTNKLMSFMVVNSNNCCLIKKERTFMQSNISQKEVVNTPTLLYLLAFQSQSTISKIVC